jgi:tetratricopeptide (TPR) repeat protein
LASHGVHSDAAEKVVNVARRAGTLGLLVAGRAQEAEPRSRDLAFEAEQLLKEHPEHPGVRMLLQSTRFVQALVAVESNRLMEALPYLDEAQAMLSDRAEGFSDLERGRAVVVMMGLFEIRGRVLLRLKKLPEATDSFRKRLEITRALADSDVSNQEMQIELCSATYALADALKWQGDLTSSESLLRQMAARVEQRTLEHPDEHHWYLELMRFRRALGSVRAARGDLAEALEENRAAVRLAADLVDRDANDESLLSGLWLAYRGILVALFAQSEWLEALVAAEQMLITSEKGLERFRNHDRWGWLMVLGHIHRAEILQKIGDTEGVKAALLDAWTRVSHLPIGSDEMEFVRTLLSLHVSAVDLEKEPDNSAIGLAKRAVKLGERALAVAPDDEPTRRRLELSYRLLSLLLKFCGKLRASRRFRRKASALRRRRARR